MLLVIRSRFPRIADVLSFVSGVIFLAIGIVAGASPTVLILGGGRRCLLSAARYSASDTRGSSPAVARVRAR